MSYTQKMNEGMVENKKKVSERNARLSEALKYWSKIKEIREGLENLTESEKLNLACNLNTQANYMKKYREQTSTSFNGFTPRH